MHELVEVVVVSHRDIWVSRTPEWRNPIPRAPCILSEEESTSGVGRREERRSAATVYLPRREIECAKQGSWGQSASQFSEPGSPHFPLHNGSNIEVGPEIELGRRESIIIYFARTSPGIYDFWTLALCLFLSSFDGFSAYHIPKQGGKRRSFVFFLFLTDPCTCVRTIFLLNNKE